MPDRSPVFSYIPSIHFFTACRGVADPECRKTEGAKLPCRIHEIRVVTRAPSAPTTLGESGDPIAANIPLGWRSLLRTDYLLSMV
jgi:hypothetical protein